MEVRFFLTPQDVVHYHRFGYRHLRQFQAWALCIVASFVWLSLLFFMPGLPFTVLPVAFRIPFYALWVLSIALYPLLLRSRVPAEAQLQGEHHMLLGPMGLRYRTWRGEFWIPWQEVRAIEQDTYNVYLLLKNNGPLTRPDWRGRRMPLFLSRVCIVPKRAFGNPLEVGTFLDQAASFRGNAQALPQPQEGFGSSQAS